MSPNRTARGRTQVTKHAGSLQKGFALIAGIFVTAVVQSTLERSALTNVRVWPLGGRGAAGGGGRGGDGAPGAHNLKLSKRGACRPSSRRCRDNSRRCRVRVSVSRPPLRHLPAMPSILVWSHSRGPPEFHRRKTHAQLGPSSRPLCVEPLPPRLMKHAFRLPLTPSAPPRPLPSTRRR